MGYFIPDPRIEEGKKLVRDIVQFLNRNDSAADHVWSILTALRGPDSDCSDLKELTTAKLRKAVGLGHGVGFAIVSGLKPPKEHYESVGLDGLTTITTYTDDLVNNLRNELDKILRSYRPDGQLTDNDQKYLDSAVDFHFVNHYLQGLKAAQILGLL